MHADEANQAVKTAQLYETGKYEYDATDHHGPSLYWLTLPSLALHGVKDLAGSREADYRVVTAIFGIGLVGLLLLLTDGLGRIAVLAAALLTAVSPAMVSYSRYYIQETLLLFFTLAALGCGWRYVRTRRLAWMLLAGAAVGMMYATKETWILSGVSAAVAAGLTWAWLRISSRHAPRAVRLLAQTAHGFASREEPKNLGGRHAERACYFHVAAGVLAACLVAIALYSQFGKDWHAPWASITAYGNYLRRGSEHGEHSEPWYYYLQILFSCRPQRGFFWSEGLVAALALVGGAYSLIPSAKPQEGSAAPCVFLTFYTLLLTVLYSAISYKTPWCALSFLLGMILLAGVGVEALFESFRVALRGFRAATALWPFCALVVALGVGILAAGALHLAWQSYRLNFDPRLVCDPRNPYVYAHTPPGLPRLAQQLDRLCRRMPPGRELTVHVVVKENYWPLPWYFRKFKPENVGYWLDSRQWEKDLVHSHVPDVLIISADIDTPGPSASYYVQTFASLRPESLVRVCVRNELWPAFLAVAKK